MPLQPPPLPIAVVLLVAIPPTKLEAPYGFQNPGYSVMLKFAAMVKCSVALVRCASIERCAAIERYAAMVRYAAMERFT